MKKYSIEITCNNYDIIQRVQYLEYDGTQLNAFSMLQKEIFKTKLNKLFLSSIIETIKTMIHE